MQLVAGISELCWSCWPCLHPSQCLFDGDGGLIWGFPKIGVPQNGWFIMENLIKMDDLGVFPLFLERPIWRQNLLLMVNQNSAKNQLMVGRICPLFTRFSTSMGKQGG